MLEGAQARRKERSWGVPLLVLALLVLALCAGGYAFSAISADAGVGSRVSQPASGAIPNPISAGELSYDEIPGFTGEPSAEVNGNVIKLEHNQFVSINRNAAVELKITLEAFGTEHKNEIIDALSEEGYEVKQVNVNI